MKKLLFTCLASIAMSANPAVAQMGKGMGMDVPAYQKMDYGTFLAATYVVPTPKGAEKNITYRGIGVPFVAPGGGKAAMIFDAEMLRYSAAWTGDFIDFKGVAFNGNHGENLGPAGKVLFQTKAGPGWAKEGSFQDPRAKNQDPRGTAPKTAYGTLPREWGRYKGLYRHEDKVIFEYTVGDCKVLDMPSFEVQDGENFFCRTVTLEKNSQPRQMVIADLTGSTVKEAGKKDILAEKGDVAMWISFHGQPASLAVLEGGRIILNLPAQAAPASFKIAQWSGPAQRAAAAKNAFAKIAPAADLRTLTHGGKARYAETSTTNIVPGDNAKAAYTLDTITVPFNNPYKSWMRLGGLDFFSDGRAAVSTWSGDVWIVSGLDGKSDKATWKRFASGLFQPLGVKIVNDVVHVLCRDGVLKLHDLNGDGEVDFIEVFNNDFIVSAAFHEFTFELQTDPQGNFYFIKAGPVKNGGRGWEEITPAHGSLFKLSKDGSKLEVIARGFRAPNGIGIGPNGEITTGDNEGTWTPTSPINWIKPGGFYGVPEFSQRVPAPTIRENPLCWLPKENPPYGQYDNSSGGQVWITGKNFGPLSGQLMHMSYGTCTLFNVLKEEVAGQMQGGVVAMPIKFDTGICRARFVEKQNALYLVGLRGWQTTATKDAGFYRMRYTGKPANLPAALHVEPAAIKVTFSDPLEKEAAEKLGNYSIQRWNYKWTETYGSPHFSVKNPSQQGNDDMELTSATLSADGKTVTLAVKDIKPVMQMRIVYRLKAADGATVSSQILHTINAVGNLRGEVHVGQYKIVQAK